MLINKIVIGCDHAGYALKEQIKQYLANKDVEMLDVGCYSTDACNYPDIAHALCSEIQSGAYPAGILICGTGIGIGIAANKVAGIRAALCHDTFSAHASREHNNANVLTMGQRVIGQGLALDIVNIWLNTEFEGGRHQRRIDKIHEQEVR